MNRKLTIALLLTVVALVGVPGALAVPGYYTVLQSIYGGPATCQLDCHTSPSGPPPFTAYGQAFSNQPTHFDITGGGTAAALIAIGPPVASIRVTPATKTLNIGQTQTFTAALFDTFGNQLTNNVSVNWTSSNTTVGTIDLITGLFTAIEAGTTIVTASDGGVGSGPVSGNATVTVTAVSVPVLTTIKVSPATVNLSVGGSQTFAAAGFDQFGAPIAISPAVVWSSSNTTVGTISNTGVFNALAAGTATITAKNGTNGTISGTATATVTAVSVKNATVTFVVTDSKTGLKIVHAQVTMDGITINTDNTGDAVFTDVALGTHIFEVSKQPYNDFVGSVNVTGDTTVPVQLVKKNGR